jgi:TonB family protein
MTGLRIPLRSWHILMFLAVSAELLHLPLSTQAQESTRKITLRTAAQYPALARSLALEGVVKVDALVEPDGSVKSVDVKGGHPVLVQAAVNTVRRWKWEPAPRETHELVEVKFSPAD